MIITSTLPQWGLQSARHVLNVTSSSTWEVLSGQNLFMILSLSGECMNQLCRIKSRKIVRSPWEPVTGRSSVIVLSFGKMSRGNNFPSMTCTYHSYRRTLTYRQTGSIALTADTGDKYRAAEEVWKMEFKHSTLYWCWLNWIPDNIPPTPYSNPSKTPFSGMAISMELWLFCRILGMLGMVGEELIDDPFYYITDDLCKIVHCTPPKFLQIR